MSCRKADGPDLAYGTPFSLASRQTRHRHRQLGMTAHPPEPRIVHLMVPSAECCPLGAAFSAEEVRPHGVPPANKPVKAGVGEGLLEYAVVVELLDRR